MARTTFPPLTREHLEFLANLYHDAGYDGPAYLVIVGDDRSADAQIAAYLPEPSLLVRAYDDTYPVWIAVVPAGIRQWCVDRLGSGLYGAVAWANLAEATDNAGEAILDHNERRTRAR